MLYADLADALYKYSHGIYSGLMNGRNNVDFNSEILAFGLKNLEAGATGNSIKTIFLYVIMDYIWEQIKSNKVERYFTIDEAWTMLREAKVPYL